MSGCQHWQERCSARLDGELSPKEQAALQAHLDGCEVCRVHMRQLEMAHVALGKLERRVAVPPSLAARIESEAIRRHSGNPWRRAVRSSWLRAVGAAAIAAALLLGIWPGRDDHSRHLPDLCTVLVEDHLRYLPASDAIDTPSPQRAAVESWFAERLDFKFPVHNLAGAHLEGGRLCFIDGRRVGLLFYRRGDTRISVFVLPEARLGGLHRLPDGTWSGGMHGYHVRAIGADGVTYAMVSDLPEETMKSMWVAGRGEATK